MRAKKQLTKYNNMECGGYIWRAHNTNDALCAHTHPKNKYIVFIIYAREATTQNDNNATTNKTQKTADNSNNSHNTRAGNALARGGSVLGVHQGSLR